MWLVRLIVQVMLLVCRDMYVLRAGDFYTFGTIVPRLPVCAPRNLRPRLGLLLLLSAFVRDSFGLWPPRLKPKHGPATQVFTVLVIAMNYRAAFLTRIFLLNDRLASIFPVLQQAPSFT